MNPKASRKNRVNRPPQSKLNNGAFEGSEELQEWRRRTGKLATLFCSSVQSLLWQLEAVQYSSGIPEMGEPMQSALLEMETLTWSIYDQLKTSTFGSEAWNKISPNERELLHRWMLDAYNLLMTFDET